MELLLVLGARKIFRKICSRLESRSQASGQCTVFEMGTVLLATVALVVNHNIRFGSGAAAFGAALWYRMFLDESFYVTLPLPLFL